MFRFRVGDSRSRLPVGCGFVARYRLAITRRRWLLGFLRAAFRLLRACPDRQLARQSRTRSKRPFRTASPDARLPLRRRRGPPGSCPETDLALDHFQVVDREPTPGQSRISLESAPFALDGIPGHRRSRSCKPGSRRYLREYQYPPPPPKTRTNTTIRTTISMLISGTSHASVKSSRSIYAILRRGWRISRSGTHDVRTINEKPARLTCRMKFLKLYSIPRTGRQMAFQPSEPLGGLVPDKVLLGDQHHVLLLGLG
jgi:hypothetical protein